MIRPEDRFERNPDIVFRRMRDELILLPIHSKDKESRQFYYVEEVGGRVWELLDGTKACRHIVETIALEFGVKKDRVGEEILAFLGDLKEEDLIRRLS